MKKLFLLIVAVLLFFEINAQIVNTEELRFDKDEKVSGLIDLGFGLTRNKAGLSLRPSADIRVEINNEKSKWLGLIGYSLSRFTNLNTGALPTNFNNKGFAHIRYNQNLSPKLTLELFSQIQYDEIQEIDVRMLNGFGPRYELFKKEENSAYVGLLYMYEYEETSADEEAIVFNKDNRLSSYLSLAYKFNEYVSVNNITYFQPNLANFNDYRLSTKLIFSAKLVKGLSMNMTFNFIYDNQPPITVPPAMYDLSTGFSYGF